MEVAAWFFVMKVFQRKLSISLVAVAAFVFLMGNSDRLKVLSFFGLIPKTNGQNGGWNLDGRCLMKKPCRVLRPETLGVSRAVP